MHNAAFLKEFGVRLEVLRNQENCSQKLATKIELRFQPLHKYESGRNIRPADILVKLAHALDATVDNLITGNLVENSRVANSHLPKRVPVLERLNQDKQSNPIKIIDMMIAKERVEILFTLIS